MKGVMFPVLFLLLFLSTSSAYLRFLPARDEVYALKRGRTCHGNVDDLTPTMDGSTIRFDLDDLARYRTLIERVADDYCIQASVIAAVASRESRVGRLLDKNGYGDGGKAYGIMQCDIRHSGLPCLDYAWNSYDHFRMMVGRLLIPDIEKVGLKFPQWTQAMKLQGGVAAYNFGVKNVQSWERLDIGTTGNNYSNDVIARAKYLRNLGWN